MAIPGFVLTVPLLSGCLAEEQMNPPTSCTDALQDVVHAEQAYDDMLAGADHVRNAVLAANRLCGQ